MITNSLRCASILFATLFTCSCFADVTDDALSFYRLNGNTLDSGSNGLHGTLFGGSFTNDRLGNPDAALLLDGVNDYVRIADSPSQNLTGDLTVAAWINIPTPEPSYGRIIFSNMQEISPHDGFSLRFTGTNFGNKLRFMSGTSVYSSNPIPLDEWVHVAATVKGNQASVWINGVFEGSASLRVPTTNSVDQGIGASYTPFYFFDGAIDDVALFGRALSQGEIQELMVAPEPTSLSIISVTMMLGLRRRIRKSPYR